MPPPGAGAKNYILFGHSLHSTLQASTCLYEAMLSYCILYPGAPLFSLLWEIKQSSLLKTSNGSPTCTSYQDQNPIVTTNETNHIVEGSNTKYDLPLRIKNKVSTYRQVLPSCPSLQAWDSQNKFKFSFIPLASLKVPDNVNPITLLWTHWPFTKRSGILGL